jgi:hypothetical protein
MRAIRFLPLAFLAGADGMALFVPYLLVVMTVVYLIEGRRARRTRLANKPAINTRRRFRFRLSLNALLPPASQVQTVS